MDGHPSTSQAFFAFRRRGSGRAVCAGMLLAFGVLLLAGCGGGELDYTEVKHINERIMAGELRSWLRVVDALPEKKLPAMPSVFVPPPDWAATRTLTVRSLVEEALERQEAVWSVERIADRTASSRAFERALRRERMTPQQFAGLTLAIGLAVSRQTIREDQDLAAYVRRGEAVLADLRVDDRTFSGLEPDARYYVLRRAAWVARLDRAEHLLLVPPENVELIRRNHERLAPLLPAEFTRNPLDAIADRSEEEGVPFDVLPGEPTDDRIEWTRKDAIVGTDAL